MVYGCCSYGVAHCFLSVVGEDRFMDLLPLKDVYLVTVTKLLKIKSQHIINAPFFTFCLV